MVRLDLPWDLVEEILSRVPAISLIRLQFICKRWNALSKDLIKKHLDKAAKQNSIFMLRNFRVDSLSVNLNEIHNQSIEFTPKLSRSLNESEKITQVFHCNGLLLCSTEEPELMVMNPFTGQTRWIEARSAYYMRHRYALGYENNNNKSYESYKILRFPYKWDQLEIFELKSNSWRVLANIPPKKDLSTYGRGVSLKGNTYWISGGLRKFDILCFDFTIERFRRLCLPFLFGPHMFRYSMISVSVVNEEQLLLLHMNLITQQMEIWFSNKIEDTKTVFSRSDSFTLGLHHQFDNHHLVSSMSFLMEEEKKVIVCCCRSVENKKKMMIHIVAEHGGCRKFDYDTDQSDHCQPFLFSYVPTLVNLNPPI